MNDECLRHQRLDEPARLKYRRAGWIPAVENPEHDEERRVIEDRADGADEKDETFDFIDVPRSWARHLLVVYRVYWNRYLREVVEKIIGQHLDGGHWDKRQEGAGAQYAKHISEVGTRPHTDVLKDVREYLPAFDHSAFENHQILLQQDQIRRFLCDVRSRVHRDADIGSSQGGSIVDSVAHEADD